MPNVVDGIVVGGAGGALAGVTICLLQLAHAKWIEWSDKKRVYAWLRENTENKHGQQSALTREIASWTNLTQDRTRYVCSIHPKVFLVTVTPDERWSVYSRQLEGHPEPRDVETIDRPRGSGGTP